MTAGNEAQTPFLWVLRYLPSSGTAAVNSSGWESLLFREVTAQLLHVLPSWQFFTARNCSEHDTHHPISLFSPQLNNLAYKGGAQNSTLNNEEHL